MSSLRFVLATPDHNPWFLVVDKGSTVKAMFRHLDEAEKYAEQYNRAVVKVILEIAT